MFQHNMMLLFVQLITKGIGKIEIEIIYWIEKREFSGVFLSVPGQAATVMAQWKCAKRQ